jgi:uncharacterized surface protein with fasciclin (FAS1) repeats
MRRVMGMAAVGRVPPCPNARFVQADIEAGNGVVQVIDEVLLPAAG